MGSRVSLLTKTLIPENQSPAFMTSFNLITAGPSYLQIPSIRKLGLQPMTMWRHTSVHSKEVLLLPLFFLGEEIGAQRGKGLETCKQLWGDKIDVDTALSIFPPELPACKQTPFPPFAGAIVRPHTCTARTVSVESFSLPVHRALILWHNSSRFRNYNTVTFPR